MKKTLGLVMALVMILTAVSAFAAAPSKTTADMVTVTTSNAKVKVRATENNSEDVVKLLTALYADNSIPAFAKTILPEGNTYSKVEEVATMKIEGGTAEEDLVINLAFPTNFGGKDVAVLLGTLEGEKIVEWKCIETVGKDDGSIDLTLDGEMQDWINGREFVALICD